MTELHITLHFSFSSQIVEYKKEFVFKRKHAGLKANLHPLKHAEINENLHGYDMIQQGSYPLCQSKFPDYSLTFPWPIVKNTHFFLDPQFSTFAKLGKGNEAGLIDR